MTTTHPPVNPAVRYAARRATLFGDRIAQPSNAVVEQRRAQHAAARAAREAARRERAAGRLPREGDKPPPSPISAEAVSRFVLQRCIVRPDATVPMADLRDAWASWATDSGIRPGSAAGFSTFLGMVVTGLGRLRAGRTQPTRYTGIKLREVQP